MAKKYEELSEKEQKLADSFVQRLTECMQAKGIKNDSEVYTDYSVDIKQSRFSELRNKKAIPSVLELRALANYFDTTIDSFVYGNSGVQKDYSKISIKEFADILMSFCIYHYIELDISHDIFKIQEGLHYESEDFRFNLPYDVKEDLKKCFRYWHTMSFGALSLNDKRCDDALIKWKDTLVNELPDSPLNIEEKTDSE